MSLLNIFKSKLLFVLFLILLFFGLFILNSINNDTRIKHEIWNASHFVVFFIFWLFMVNLFSWLRPLDIKRAIIILVASLIISAGIEWFQIKVGRSASWDDVKLSVAGSLALIGVYIFELNKNRFIAYTNIIVITLCSIVLSWSSLKIFMDEIYIVKQGPILSDFSTPFERSRWSGSFSNIAVVSENNRDSLLVTLRPGHWFSTAELRHFYNDWSGYTKIIIELDYLGLDTFKVSVRVHDKRHRESWYAYDDRFTRSILLNPGKNVLEFDIEEIRNAPLNRDMDMSTIEALMIIARKFEGERRIKINRVYLQ